jgi:hypothetical protein
MSSFTATISTDSGWDSGAAAAAAAMAEGEGTVETEEAAAACTRPSPLMRALLAAGSMLMLAYEMNLKMCLTRGVASVVAVRRAGAGERREGGHPLTARRSQTDGWMDRWATDWLAGGSFERKDRRKEGKDGLAD